MFLVPNQLSLVIKPNADLAGLYEEATEVEQVFIKKLALFFTGEEAVLSRGKEKAGEAGKRMGEGGWGGGQRGLGCGWEKQTLGGGEEEESVFVKGPRGKEVPL